MPEHVVVTINGQEYLADPGQNLMSLINESGIGVPSLCYHESLGPIETCDTCIVEINGELKRACSQEVKAGMVILTDTKDAKGAQDIGMNRMLVNHELYCTVCDYNNGSCEIHNSVKTQGIEHQTMPYEHKPYEADFSGPFYRYDPDQCILCGRCVEACQNAEVNETLSIDWSLDRPRVVWDGGTTIDESSCVNCGMCSTVCPCNAMMEKGMVGEAGYLTGIEHGTLRELIELTKKVETGYGSLMALSDSESEMREERVKKTKTVCTYCGVGCSFDVWTKDRKVLKVQPQPESPANGIATCVKGKFGWDYVNSPERIKKPLVRRGDEFVEVSWDEAFNVVSEKMKQVKIDHGADAIGVIASSKASNEESYLMQKFARQVIGTNNVDNCSRYCQSPATKGLFRTVGYGGDAGALEDIENADLVITIGSNTAESHPVLASKIKRAQKTRGSRLVVADLRKHEMAERADRFIHPTAGSDLLWLSGVSKYILDQGWEHQEFISNRVEKFEDFKKSLEPYTLDYVSEKTGLTKEELIAVAEEIHAAENVVICWAMGVTQQKGGSDTSTAISNLLLLTGNYGRHGTGAYPLRGHNNVQGASDFGSMPNNFPGYQDVSDDEIRAKFNKAWDADVPAEPGLNNHEMVEAIHDGHLKVLYLQGEDMGIVDSNINHVQSAFEKLDFFVVQDLFLTKTASFADVVFPASPSFEKEGSFTNTERRIQRFYQVFDPLGDSKPDWQIVSELAKRMGRNWNYNNPGEIMAEVASLDPMIEGVNYERLEGYKSLQWPVKKDGTDSPYLYGEGFHFKNKMARFHPVEWTEPTGTSEKHDLHVNTGRLLEHFHEGNMTYKTHGIARKTPKAFIEVSPELAKDRGIKDGSLVRLINDQGAVKGNVLVTDRVTGKELYIPLNDNGELAVNHLTSNEVDSATDTPAYKDTAVRMEILSVDGEHPLPKNNHRYGNRTPKTGVEVEKKWEREDYMFPGEVIKRKEELKARG